jgi:hypothetical protein
MELTKQQETFLAQPFLRPFILFAVMFVATRNIAIAFWSTIGILAIIWIFANENHILCLIPHWRTKDEIKSKEQEESYQNNMKALQKKGDDHSSEQHNENAVHSSQGSSESPTVELSQK